MEKQIMPEVKIVDIKALRERAGAFLSGVWNAGRSVELCLSEHNSGASVMLDQALDNQPQLPFEDGGRLGRPRALLAWNGFISILMEIRNLETHSTIITS